ncbi:MAG TPA: ABC transporter permease [Planctomycetota bacterium]|nr:ABC transporter permease [Planctomycetota bacterium]
MFSELIVEALRNLMRHKLRSLLTALGIIFGIASVVSMVSAGEGARREILAQIRELGTNNVIVNAQKPPAEQNTKKAEGNYLLTYGLTFHDLQQIRNTLPPITDALPVHDVKDWIWFKSRRVEAKIRGVTPRYFDRLQLIPILGRILDQQDAQDRNRVCVVRARVLQEARYTGDPLKLDLKIGSEYYRVVGVLPDFTSKNPDRAILGLDDRALEVYVPFETVVDRLGLTKSTFDSGSWEMTRVELHQIVCTVDSEDNVTSAARGIQTILARFHDRRDYQVTVPIELLQSRAKTQRTFDIVLPVIAGIALLVGGIGILNIMLASVTERTREIGIRRAIGASRFDITLQFLIETVTLALVGGVLGVLLGVLGSKLIEQVTEWKPVITFGAVAVALGISCLTGIVFGIYPAHRAATMDPVRALRHE